MMQDDSDRAVATALNAMLTMAALFASPEPHVCVPEWPTQIGEARQARQAPGGVFTSDELDRLYECVTRWQAESAVPSELPPLVIAIVSRFHARLAEGEHQLDAASAVIAPEMDARIAIRAILRGELPPPDGPDAAALAKLPDVLDAYRVGRIGRVRVSDGRTPALTDDDVAAARQLVDLVRAGAPKDEVIAAARTVHKLLNRPLDPGFSLPREQHERELLDALRARGVDPTDADMADVRRLAALQVEDADDAIDVATESKEITRRLFRLRGAEYPRTRSSQP